MDPFSTLGLPARYDLTEAEIERRYRDLQRTLHPDRMVGRPAQERRIALGKAVEVNEAYRTLRDDLARAQALLTLRGHEAREQQPDPEFLMEVMERREALSDARDAKDHAAIAKLADAVRRDGAAARAKLVELFGENDSPLATLADVLGRMRYYRRFLDEVEAFEEDAAR